VHPYIYIYTMNQPRLILNDWQQETGTVGINQFLSSNQLVRTGTAIVTGDTVRSTCAGTIAEYHGIWLQLLNFAIVREDYQSASLLARALAPDNPLPIRPQLLAEFLCYKSLQKEEYLFEYKTNTRIMYRTSETSSQYLNPTGDWNCKVAVYKFRSAVLFLHRLYNNLRSQYFAQCVHCVLQQESKSCTRHVP
jgi:hypothetical protein